MAVDGVMFFKPFGADFLASEDQVNIAADTSDLGSIMNRAGVGKLFEIENFNLEIEQTLNIGSQSTGAGAGKVAFNPFSITRKVDLISPGLFEKSCSGTPFEQIALGLRKSAGGAISGRIYLVFRFKLVAVKTMSWFYDDEGPKETVTFGYGGLQIKYAQQKPDGTFKPPVVGGWDRVRNVLDDTDDLIK